MQSLWTKSSRPRPKSFETETETRPRRDRDETETRPRRDLRPSRPRPRLEKNWSRDRDQVSRLHHWFKSRVLAHFSGCWGLLLKQSTCIIQFLWGVALREEYLHITVSFCGPFSEV